MGFKRSSNDNQWSRSIAVQWVSDSYRPLNGYAVLVCSDFLEWEQVLAAKKE